MAFVNRSEKVLSHVKSTTGDQIGPGAYIAFKEYNEPPAFVPFVTKEQRGIKRNKEKDAMPGPGAYEISRQIANEKVVVSSANDEIKIVEVPKPQTSFKSQTKRFVDDEKANENPGPGQYESFEPFDDMVQKGRAHNSKVNQPDMVENLKRMSRYQSIPSIPTKKQMYGYSENEFNDFVLNQIPVKLHTGNLRDSVGPGQYELKDCFEIAKDKGAAWHKLKEERMKVELAKTSQQVGPGAYEVLPKNLPLFKMKQSSGFASRSGRQIEGYRGVVATKFIKDRVAKRNALNSANSANPNDLLNAESDSEDDEFIEGAVPGPGHYFTDKDQSSFPKFTRSNSHGNFGSFQKRFSSGPVYGGTIGPGEYNPIVAGVIGKKPNDVKKRNPPFLTSDTRFSVKKLEDEKPGPGTYETGVNLENKLIQKVQNGYRGNFGTTERRFKNEALIKDQPGPGMYIQTMPKSNEDSEIPAQTYAFKSNSKRAIFKSAKDIKPPVGSYELDFFNIEKKVNHEQEDPTLMIQVPNLGFNTSEQRFKLVENKRVDENEEGEITLDLIKQQRKEDQQFKKENKHFNTKANRFNYKQKNIVPAPGHYTTQNGNGWTKRTYNIHFAEFSDI